VSSSKHPPAAPTALLTTPFGATSTAAEVVEGLDLRGRTALVTGAASGIGVVLARTKAAAGTAAKTAEQGAATSVLLATWPGLAGVGGRYFEDCQQAAVVPEIVDGLHGVRNYALDPASAERLWEISETLLDGARSS